jgi:hypothetical protein
MQQCTMWLSGINPYASARVLKAAFLTGSVSRQACSRSGIWHLLSLCMLVLRYKAVLGPVYAKIANGIAVKLECGTAANGEHVVQVPCSYT